MLTLCKHYINYKIILYPLHLVLRELQRVDAPVVSLLIDQQSMPAALQTIWESHQ